MRIIALTAAVPAALVLLAPAPALARDKCIAVMQLVGVPAGVAAESDEGGDDANGDGSIWISMGSGRMTGFLDCSQMPGSQHGDIYEQNYSGGEARKTGNSQASGQLGRKWFEDSARRHASTGSTGSGGGSTSTSSSSNNDSRPPQGQSAPARKKKAVAQTQR